MKRIFPSALLLVTLSQASIRPAAAQELVYYLIPEKRMEAKDALRGRIRAESPGGVTINVGKGDQVVPALDVVQVCYDLPKVPAAEFRGAFGKITRALNPRLTPKEQHEHFLDALKAFSELARADGVATHPYASRYVQYRIADIQYLMSKNDPSLRPKAIQSLEEFAAANPGGWEIVPTLKTLARLHEEDNELPKAMSALERLADLPDAPKDIKRESNITASQMMMRARDFAGAEKRLSALLDSLPPGDPKRAATQVYLVQTRVAQKKTDGAEKQLKDAIAGTAEPLLRGIAYNVLGDYYRGKGQTEDAFWAYLRVDAMYNLDTNEHAKALYFLSQLFKEKKFGDRTGDPVRAKNYHDRLMDKRYADSEYQKLAGKTP